MNLKSVRSRKAKISVILDSKSLRAIFVSVFSLSLLAWVYLVIVQNVPAANLLLIVASYSLMPIFWYHGELKSLKTVPGTIEGILDRKILGRLKNNSTPKNIAKIVNKSNGGYFFAARFGIGPDFLLNVPDDFNQTNNLWQEASRLASISNQQDINSAFVVCSLIQLIPNNDDYLAQIKIDQNDLLSGANWYAHTEQVAEHQKTKRSSGGIGRDMSFGWAPLLNRIGLNLTHQVQTNGELQREIEGREQTNKQIINLLNQAGRHNATLVGEIGVGKTTIVEGLAQKFLNGNYKEVGDVKYCQIIQLDAASLIANTNKRGELESLLIQIFNEALSAKNIIVYLDKAQLFLRDGTGSVDLSNILLPILEGGALRMIISLDEQEWLHLSQVNPGLSQLMNRVVVSPLDEKNTMQIIENQVLRLEAKNRVIYMYPALKEAYKLADRFIQEQAFPGKAIKLLEDAAGFVEQERFVTSKSVQEAVEKSYGVKVQTASTNEERDVLLNLEDKIHERMVNQTRAVKVVSDSLRRARAGVRNLNKPIGTFLFLGPTGVGKTELSKSLASVYFNGEDRIIRVDLNDFSQAQDTTRLLAVGGEDPNSLCAQIAKQPFSVVLLDEIEKAHPNVLNLLLQMLDEGILRDNANKPISFKDSIIITTSNAGADQIRKHIQDGESLEKFEQQFIDELIDSNTFKPEFINRFDEVVLFRPLEKAELVQIVELSLNSLNKTLDAQKISVNLTHVAKEYLADTGYDPRLGARPLRRMMQRAVENIVAQKLLNKQVEPGQVIEIDVPELEKEIASKE